MCPPVLRSIRATMIGSALLMSVFPVHAQFNTEVLGKWGPVEVLKYKVLASFKGEAPVVIGNNGIATVSDRYEIEFRWNQYDAELVGEPLFRNFPAEYENLHGPDKCDTPKVTGTYDLATVVSVSPGYTADLHLTISNELAAAIAPVNCAGNTAPTPGQITEEILPLPIPGISMWAMPAGTAPNMKASGDSLTVTDGDWTYVYTLSKD